MIRIVKPGMLTTVQDLGRFGFAHLGVSSAGAADPLLFRAANLLVGNQENAPALECTMIGPTLEFDRAEVVAIAGLDEVLGIQTLRAIEIRAGDRISVGPITTGVRAYIAVRGGFDVPSVLRSHSTFLPGHMGGYHGRALRAGDTLSLGACATEQTRTVDSATIRSIYASRPLRATPSTQADWFDPSTFYNRRFTISDHSNRSGLRLAGDAVARVSNRELLTEGAPLGAVQVPPDGQPIILFVDQNTTGGYPKIANVIAADLPRVAQLRPRESVSFKTISIADAVEALREQEHAFREAFRR